MNEARPDKSDILAQHCRFDPEWYRARYPDVALLDMSPQAHFLSLGCALHRGVSADHPTGAGLETLGQAVSRKPVISYCIPVMDRLADLQATLSYNLEGNRALAADLEFLVVVFEPPNGPVARWLQTTFPADLATGYLRVVTQAPLPVWHFGQAKNAFRPHYCGAVYSSLDADNFVTAQETRQLLDIATEHGAAFVMHHFSGVWGDGSSGRVSLPSVLYDRLGYDDRFLPRQFDEVDVILSVLSSCPGVPLLRYRTERSVLDGDQVQAFLQRRMPEQRFLEQPETRPPLNPNAADYLEDDFRLEAMQTYNAAMCFLKNDRSRKEAIQWIGRLRRAARQFVTGTSGEVLFQTLFRGVLPDLPPEVRVRCVTRAQDTAQPEGPDEVIIDARPQSLRDPMHATGPAIVPRVGHVASARDLWVQAMIKSLNARGIKAIADDA